MKLCKNYPQDNPVVVLFAYSKLLTMDEKSLNLVLEEDEVKELESVRSVFEKRNIDYKLIKIGAPLIIPLSDSFESRFKSLLKGYKGAEKSSAQAVEIALKSVSSSFNKSFRSGNSLDDVHDLESIDAVEISRRFVRDDDLRILYDSSRYRHPLALTA